MKWREQLRELRNMNLDALKAKEKEMGEELLWLKIKVRSGQNTNNAILGRTRRNVARVKTLIRQKGTELKKVSK